MANESVIFEVIAQGKGLKVVQRDVDALATSTERTNKARKEGSKGQDNYNKKEKAIHQSNLSSSKAFSKMNQTIGTGSSGLVGAYAVLAANVFAATAAFNALRQAAQVETLIAGLEATGAAAGKNLTVVAQRMKDVTGSAISMEQAMRSAAQGASAGFSDAQMAKLTETAKAAAISLGRDVGDAVDRVTRGVAKLEPEILDELGLFVRLDDATERYAGALGKSVDSLTQFERTQAFANATIAAGEKRVREMGGAVDANPYDKLAASLSELGTTFLNFFNTVLTPFVSILADSKIALAGLIAMLTKGIIGSALPVLTQLGNKAKQVAAEALGAVNAAKAAAVENVVAQAKGVGNLDVQVKGYKEMAQEIRNGNLSRQGIVAAEDKIKNSIKIRMGLAKKMEGEQRAAAVARIKELRAELGLLRQIRHATDDIGRQKAPLLGSGAAAGAFGEGSAGIMASLDEDGSFKNYKKQMKNQLDLNKLFTHGVRESGDELEFFGSKIGGIGKKMKVAGAAMAGFGAAGRIAIKGLFTAIPVIGQLLFVVDLALVGLKSAFDAVMGYAKAQTELEKAQSRLNTINSSYAETLEKIALTEELTADQVLQRGNATQQLVGATRELMEAQKEAKDEAGFFGKVFSAIGMEVDHFLLRFSVGFRESSTGLRTWAAETKLLFVEWINSLKEGINDLMKGAFGDFLRSRGFKVELFSKKEMDANVDAAKKGIDDIKRQSKDLVSSQALAADTSRLAISAPFQTIQKIMEEGGKGAEELKSHFKGVTNVSDHLLGKFNDIAKSGLSKEMIKSFSPDIQKRIEKYLKSIKDSEKEVTNYDMALNLMQITLEAGTANVVKQATAIEELNKSFRDSPKIVNEFANGMKSASEVKNILPIYRNLLTNFQTLAGEGKALEEQLAKMPDSLAAFVRQATKGKDVTEANLKLLVDQLNTINQFQVFEKARTMELERQSKALKAQHKENTVAIEYEIDLQKTFVKDQIASQTALLEINKNRITDETKRLMKEGKMLEITDEQLEIVGKVAELEQTVTNSKEKQYLLEHDTSMIAKANLASAKSRFDLAKQTAKTATMELKLEMKKQNMAKGKGTKLTPAQEIKLKAKAAADILANTVMEQKLKMDMLKIEQEIAIVKLEAAGVHEEKIKEIARKHEQILETHRKISDEIIKQAKLKAQDTAVDIQAGDGAPVQGAEGAMNWASATQESFEEATAMRGELLKQREKKMEELRENLANAQTTKEKERIQAQIDALAALLEEGGLTFAEKIKAHSIAFQPLFDQLNQLGPEGQFVAALGQGSFSMVESIGALAQGGMDAADKLSAVANIVGQIGAIAAAAGKMKIAAIDKEIEKTKQLYGGTAKGEKMIQALEKKKEAQKKKSFELNKKMMMAQAVMSTAMAILNVWSDKGNGNAITRGILSGMVAAIGAAQLAIISSMSYSGGGSSAPSAGPSKVSIGSRSNKVDVAGSRAGGELAYMRGQRGVGSSASDFSRRGAFVGAKYRATGGAAYVVGEQGPELFVPQVPGQIVANDELEEGGMPANVTFNIQTIDATNMEETLISQRGNIINMIREAANNQGETFLEGLDTMALGDNY